MASDSDSPRLTRRRIITFVTVVLSILLSGNALVCATWNFLWPTPGIPLWTALSFLLTLVFVATSVLSRRFFNPLLSLAYTISAVWLGFLNYFLFASFAAWILAAVTHLDSKCIAAICFGSAVVITLYGLANASVLRVRRVTVNLANLPKQWHGRGVALVTDMHLGNIRGARFTKTIVDRIQKLGVEAVFISGDLFDGPEADYHAMVEPWKKISDTTKIYFVTGNHEEFSDRTKYIKAVESAGIRVLTNERVEHDGLQIVGIHDEELHDPKVFRAILQCAQLDRTRASILLAHQPKFLQIPGDAGISLTVCGHTHGGQFWPWIYAARRVHKQFNHGLQRFKDMQVFTSYGIGTWGAPMRVGTKSEIVLIRLEPAI